ncbi:MAG: hypothetical protein HEP70_13270 [Rhodobiaceae bacterium]|nr:hypothetical protein [Rhodobiaceae bacterium]
MAVNDQDHIASVALIDGQGRIAAADASTNADGTHTLQLSLFLMLLTFFFVLTSGSSFDEQRVGPVIGGIQDAFGVLNAGKVDDDGRLSGSALPVLQHGSQPASGDFSNAVVTAFADVGEQESIRRGGSLDLALDVSSLFVDGAAAIRADKRLLFAALGAALSGGSKDRHVAILVPAASQNRLDVRRAASLARLLSVAGTPEGHMAVGVTDAPREFVSFRFFTLPEAAS